MTKEQEASIASEVRALLERRLAEGVVVQTDWLIHEVIGEWEAPRGRDADRWTFCAYQAVRKIVRDVVRKGEAPSDDSPQLVLEGFEKLHRWYPIVRADDRVLCPTELLTVEEAFAVIEDLRRCQRGLDQHINELLRYIDEVIIPRDRGVA